MFKNILLSAFITGSINIFAEALNTVTFSFRPVCLRTTMPNTKVPSIVIRTVIAYKEKDKIKKLFVDIDCGTEACVGVAMDITESSLGSGGAAVMADLHHDGNSVKWVLGSFDIDSEKSKVIYKVRRDGHTVLGEGSCGDKIN